MRLYFRNKVTMFKHLSICTITLCFYLLLTFSYSFAQDYSDANDIPMTAINSVKESINQTEKAIENVETGLNMTREFLNSSAGKNLPQDKKLQLLQKIAEAEYALNESKLPLKDFNKYADKINKANEIYTELTSINEKYNRRKELQGALAANLGFISDTMKTYGNKIPILGDAIEGYSTITSGLLDKTEQLAINIDKNQNQNIISGQGLYKTGEVKVKYDKLFQKYPTLAENFTYMPKTPQFLYEAVEPGQPALIWDEDNKEFYALPPGIPVEKLYKFKLLTNHQFTPYELKIVSEKWDTVGKNYYIDAVTIGSVFTAISKQPGYNDAKEIFWNVRNNNSDLMQELFNDQDTFQARYMFDSQFRQAANKAFNNFYNQLCQNPNTHDSARGLFDLLKEFKVSFNVPPPPDKNVATKPQPKPYPKASTQTKHSWPTNHVATKPQPKPYTPPVTYQPPAYTQPPSQNHDSRLDEYGKEKQKVINGQKVCAAFMTSLVNDYASRQSATDQYKVEFTRSYNYENGYCVGSHIVWLKTAGKDLYPALEFYSPSSPAKLNLSEVKAAWQSKNPNLDWGN